MDLFSVLAFFFLLAVLIWGLPYAQTKREQEIYERMKALREADAALPKAATDTAAIALASLDASTRQTRDDAESINQLNRGRLE